MSTNDVNPSKSCSIYSLPSAILSIIVSHTTLCDVGVMERTCKFARQNINQQTKERLRLRWLQAKRFHTLLKQSLRSSEYVPRFYELRRMGERRLRDMLCDDFDFDVDEKALTLAVFILTTNAEIGTFQTFLYLDDARFASFIKKEALAFANRLLDALNLFLLYERFTHKDVGEEYIMVFKCHQLGKAKALQYDGTLSRVFSVEEDCKYFDRKTRDFYTSEVRILEPTLIRHRAGGKFCIAIPIDVMANNY